MTQRRCICKCMVTSLYWVSLAYASLTQFIHPTCQRLPSNEPFGLMASTKKLLRTVDGVKDPDKH